MLIICGTDFSPDADRAAAVAAKLARLTKSKLQLISVVAPGGAAEVFEHALNADADDLAEQFLGVDIDRILARGDPAVGLVQEAEQAHADLLIVAARGESRAKDRLGRVAERVAAQASVPVLVVRDADTLLSWLDGVVPLRTLLAASLEPSQEAAVELLSMLREAAPCDVTALHVCFPPALLSAMDVHWPKVLDDDKAKEVLGAELKRRVLHLKGSGDVSVAVAESLGRVDDRLLSVARERNAALIVLGAHRRKGAERFWHASVAASVLRHAHENVLIVPDSIRRHELPAVSRVLVAVDDVDGAARSVALACALAGPAGEVRLFHVIEKDERVDQAKLREELRMLLPRIAASTGLRVEIDIVEGTRVAEAICAAALRTGADLVCLRARVRRTGALARLGSVLDEVAARCPRPVVVVRDDA